MDFIFFMTYEWGWSGGPPMAVSPLNQVRRVLDYAISVVPREKVMMGIPLYGYDWTLPYEPGGRWARSISSQQAIELAARYGVSINYDHEVKHHFSIIRMNKAKGMKSGLKMQEAFRPNSI